MITYPWSQQAVQLGVSIWYKSVVLENVISKDMLHQRDGNINKLNR
jgi:hypothetical protein